MKLFEKSYHKSVFLREVVKKAQSGYRNNPKGYL